MKTLLNALLALGLLSLGAARAAHAHEGPHATPNSQPPPKAAPAPASEASARPGFRAELKTTPSTIKAGRPVTLILSVKDAKGTLVRELPQVHEKPMHLLAISRDLAEFAHLHPKPQPDGTYQVRHTFPSGGAYKLYVDYTPSGSPQVVDQIEVAVEGPSRPASRLTEDATPTKTADGVRVTMSTGQPLRAGAEAMLRFTVADAKTGKPVTDLQPYLGALAHFVILSEDTQDFLHAHPLEAKEASGGAMAGHAHKQGEPGGKSPSEVLAHTSFPRAGLYKVWTQLQRGGRVITVPFVVRVDKAAGPPAPQGGHGAHGAATPVPANAIQVKVSAAGFTPSRVKVQAGKPVTLAFERTDARNCGDKVVFPSLGIERELPVGQTVTVTVEPPKTGELTFTCGMAMYRGALVVQ
jgi:plastocyanin